MRVAVIGATGHIGSFLVPRLVRDGHDVVAISRGQRSPYHDAPEWSEVQRVPLDRMAQQKNGSYGSRIASLAADVVIDLICFEERTARELAGALRGRVGLFLHCGTIWVHGTPLLVEEKPPQVLQKMKTAKPLFPGKKGEGAARV